MIQWEYILHRAKSSAWRKLSLISSVNIYEKVLKGTLKSYGLGYIVFNNDPPSPFHCAKVNDSVSRLPPVVFLRPMHCVDLDKSVVQIIQVES